MPDHSGSFDVIVIGCGGMGSAVMSHLARRGVRVLGIDQFSPPHDRGSSHGETRVIRKAYFEHPNYVPLLHRAYTLWDQLSDRTAHLRPAAERDLFVRCGLLLAGPGEGEVIAGARESARQHQLDLQTLSPAVCRTRFPMFRLPDSLDVVFEADAGYLKVERCVEAHLADALTAGACLLRMTHVIDLEWQKDSVRVRTAGGEAFAASVAVVTAGPWISTLLSDYASLVHIRRKSLFWLPLLRPETWRTPDCPVHLIDLPDTLTSRGMLAAGQFYGFPSVDGRTVKVAEHSGGTSSCSPDDAACDVPFSELERTCMYSQHFLNGPGERPVRTSTCYYSMSPDGHFLIDRLPDSPVVVAAGFSGHGFKFSSVVGEGVADLAQTGQSGLPLQFLSAARLR